MYKCHGCKKSYDRRKSLNSHYYRKPNHKPEEWQSCPGCGERFNSLENHWSSSSCDRPSFNNDYSCVYEHCGQKYRNRGSLISHYNNHPEHRPKDWTTCPTCNLRFKSLGTHWSINESDCYYPNISSNLKNILIGLLMGDGTLHRDDHAMCRFKVGGFTTPEYLEWLDGMLGVLSTGVEMEQTAEEAATNENNYGSDPENLQDRYMLCTRIHPFFDDLSEWYGENGKEFPQDLDMNPTVLTHWFISDGHFDNKNGQYEISIGISNERINKDKISKYFSDKELPKPSRFSDTERKDGSIKCDAWWNVNPTKKLFNYMNSPPPGFEYKWPDQKDY